MALSEIVRKVVDSKVSKFCQDRIPPHARDQVRLHYKIRGYFVTLIESRPSYFEKDVWIDIPAAQFRYDEKSNQWSLFWPDRNSRWHEYYDCDSSHDIDDLIREVDEDPSCVFWG